jgi:hypothetical protein
MESVRDCGFRYEPDLMSLMITWGRRGELADLKRKMRCPMCGSGRITVSRTLPGQSDTAAIRAELG